MNDISVAEQPPIIKTEIIGTNVEKPKPDIRQQSKIVGIILRDDRDLISSSFVQLKPGERDEYLKRVSQGAIGEASYSKLLNSISTPISYERDERNPVETFNQISTDRQVKGIIATFVRGDLKARDSLTPQDLYSFLRQKFPNALAYEKALGLFLDRIEYSNDKQKRLEYEGSAERLGSVVYGKQWEYLKQIRLLEEEVKVGQRQVICPAEENKQLNSRNGQEQTQKFNKEHRLTGKVFDGYKDGGRATRFDSQGRAINPSREVIVVDRKRDIRLQRMIEKAKTIQARYGTGLRTIFELSKLVYDQMYDLDAVSVVEEQLEATPGREVLLGDITVENGLAGVCRHRSLLFQVLAADVGINTSLVRGKAAFGDYVGGHAWNEVELCGKHYLVDIMNPPGRSNFKSFDFTNFTKQGGFPEIGTNRSNIRYMDVRGIEFYRV